MLNKSKTFDAVISENGNVELTYVVLRNGLRVSDSEYSTVESAKSEYDHWRKIVNRWPDGTKVVISTLTKKS